MSLLKLGFPFLLKIQPISSSIRYSFTTSFFFIANEPGIAAELVAGNEKLKKIKKIWPCSQSGCKDGDILPPQQLFGDGLTLAQLSSSQNSIRDYLAVHNAARAKVGIRPLSWNRTMAAYANKYAKSRLPVCDEFEHSGGPYGENLAEGWGEFSGADAVRMWIGEKGHYNHRSNSCVGSECLHYTQVVWRNSVSVGCARVRCNQGLVFITCNYYPPGNYIGESPY